MKARIGAVVMALVIVLLGLAAPGYLVASDHDDGETDTKGRNMNLTDLYAFREVDQNASAGANELVLIMNTNPRSVARQQYYFSSRARYEFHVTRVQNIDATPTGRKNVTLRLTFSEPDAQTRQRIRLTVIRGGSSRSFDAGMTTPRTTNPTDPPVINNVNVGGQQVRIFAGLRQDVFFFDVEAFFRVRAGALGFGPAVGFRNPGHDFTWGYNTNSIVVGLPRTLLGAGSIFDVWETISVPAVAAAPRDNDDDDDDDDRGGQGAQARGFVQVERLARPAINEGLIVTNAFLNALNSVGPDFEARALQGRQPEAGIAGPIVEEAKRTLKAFGNTDAQADALLAAFLPDVMRIDTSKKSGYAACLNAKGSPSCGRLILDDVIDITLTVVSRVPGTQSDNVAYTSVIANSTPHSPLFPNFPYLPAPH